ncbi:hypothetical protein FQR65_LT00367 [Abscondita terminalis]|nr:hypothetical protein FQR65_LT00367 [Abscondita terminalis]
MMKLPQDVIDKIEERVQEVIKLCSNTTANNDAPSLQNDTLETRENGKCPIACVLKKEGFLNDNGTIDQSGAKEAVKRFTSKENLGEYENELVKVVELCTENSFQNEDECETAKLMQTCMSKKTTQQSSGNSYWTTILNYFSKVVKTIISPIVNIIKSVWKR